MAALLPNVVHTGTEDELALRVVHLCCELFAVDQCVIHELHRGSPDRSIGPDVKYDVHEAPRLCGRDRGRAEKLDANLPCGLIDL